MTFDLSLLKGDGTLKGYVHERYVTNLTPDWIAFELFWIVIILEVSYTFQLLTF